ncbi:MAG: exodeoxyribonuclease VII large subunit [Catonella sp.]|nr:exodeoxyribonuclease VII large subunit [Catonella sp.]MDY6355691.1 exodeoxyribonuclease VII large subunit [Catonella sp.]
MSDKVFSVSQVSFYVKDLFERDMVLQRILVKGEVGSVKYHSSGHVYFSLKDENAVINCVMWRSTVTSGLKFRLTEGQKIVVTGSLDTYEKNSSYQLYARKIELDGTGKLFAEFERLKKKLEAEGLFDKAKKKPVPEFPKTVGIVTAETGAAIHDIMQIAGRRDPYVQLVLYPAKVQGEGAAESIVKGIERLDKYGVDTIIVGRGGGSMEDLWCFNDERVARAIFACNTPVISAVGHEVDFTISDFVADLRAATPSEAAEYAVPDLEGVLAELDATANFLRVHMNGKLRLTLDALKKYELELIKDSPAHRLDVLNERLDENVEKLNVRISRRLGDYDRHCENSEKKLISDMRLIFEKKNRQFLVLTEKLNGLSPLARLTNGYSYVSDEEGKNIKSLKDIETGQNIRVTLADGAFKAEVKEIEKAQ